MLVMLSGCTCRRDAPTPGPLDSAPSAVDYELTLHRTALVAFGSSTPLPVSEEFNEEVPAARPTLERAAGLRPNLPLRMKVSRDVPYGQLTRLMQAALAFRVVQWELSWDDANGAPAKITLRGPGPTPRGSCWARAWVGPDARVVAGIDLGADAAAPMTGVLVNAKDGQLRAAAVVDIIRRMDARCKAGDIRIYSQASARSGPALDLARAFAEASPKPHVGDVVLAVPSIGPLDSNDEIAP
jgi:hypothetical protein